MERTAGQRTATPRGVLRRLRWPLATSLVLHGLVLAGAIWWAVDRSAAEQVPVAGILALRPAAAEPELVPEVIVTPPDLEDEFDFADALEQVVLEAQPVQEDELFDDETDCEAAEPLTCFEVPLTAAQGREPPPPPAPLVPVRVAPRPKPRPAVVTVRPAPRRPPPPPRAAPVPVRNPPLRVVFAPDRRRYYPQAALRRGLGGRTLVRLTIDANGRVTSAAVAQTSGYPVLDRAAVALAYAYRFTTGYGMRATRLPVSFRPPAGRYGS